MDVSFVNKYTVSKEGHSAFHIPPKRRDERSSAPKASPVGAKLREWNGWIRILGICVAALIIVMAIIQRTWILAVIGVILVALYAIRIYQAHTAEKEAEARAVPPPSPEFDASGKWTRYVRFGDHIEKEDPGITQEYEYYQIKRISDDPAYITLWMDNNTQVRVLKKGFIIGTLDGFKQFIMARTGRLIGPPASDARAGEDGSQAAPAGDALPAEAADGAPGHQAPAGGATPDEEDASTHLEPQQHTPEDK